MKGLDWFKVMSNIAFDNDLEHVSDAAFRTFIELVGISAFRLSDGRVCRRDALKMCNARHLNAAVEELSRSGQVFIEGDMIIIRSWAKYQQTRAEVETEREKVRERVWRYRDSSNGGSSGAKSKSKSKKEEGEPESDPLVLLAITEIPVSDSTTEDYRTVIGAQRVRLTDAHIERIILQLAGWKIPKNRAKLHLTLRSWLAKEPEDRASEPSPQYPAPNVPEDW